ncbi:hypothetical protein [Priestia megaterium]|uniref:hypothetical protein n=1 Tax=Priestia megaterium TaxID=1404 RepID=UPI00164984DF|nr:hypothetical protein [Priestia megaterium]
MMRNELFEVVKMLELVGMDRRIRGMGGEMGLRGVELGIELSKIRRYGKVKEGVSEVLDIR